MTDEELGRAEANRLGIEPATCELSHKLRWPDLPSPLGLDDDFDIWSEVSQAYSALGRAVRAARAACGYDAELARLTQERDAWKSAVIDVAVENWTLAVDHEDHPRKAVNALLAYAIDQERDKLRKQVEQLTQERDAARAERDAFKVSQKDGGCCLCTPTATTGSKMIGETCIVPSNPSSER